MSVATGRVTGGLLTATLREPERLVQWSPAQWDLLLRQARRAGLTARLHVMAEDLGGLDAVPPRVLRHLQAAGLEAGRHAEAVRWEVRRIEAALREAGVPVVLLKGAAYVVVGAAPWRGRVFGDVDIMVPHAAIDGVERILRMHGWLGTHPDPYDQRYYRQWMHELPPLRHGARQTVLDVHHTILPPTARPSPDPRKLFAAARPVAGFDEIYVLGPEDMVLHSATHLFHDGELEHGLRDLVDLHLLLGELGREEGFWVRLAARAVEMDLARPLHYALRYAGKLLDARVPDGCLAALARAGPGPALRPLMDALFARGLAPDHPSCRDALTGPARGCLYVRAHYLRMPLYLLIPHLARKAVRRTSPD